MRKKYLDFCFVTANKQKHNTPAPPAFAVFNWNKPVQL